MQQRKFITVERSTNKESARPSYEVPVYRETYDTNFHDLNRYGSTAQVKPRGAASTKMDYSDLHKSPSESNFKSRE